MNQNEGARQQISETSLLFSDKLLGQGTFGQVYEGLFYDVYTQIQKKCAIKCISGFTLKRTLDENQQMNKYYENEIKICEKIRGICDENRQKRALSNNPSNYETHIVEIYEIVRQQDKTYIVMEFCEITLESYKFKQVAKRLDIVQTMKYAEQILKGLSILHSIPIIHRDLKPDNIFLVQSQFSQSYIVKIGDFNISSDEFQTSSTVGTINYMAPELVSNILNQNEIRKPYSNKVDIWAVGVIIHEMISGCQLFPGNHTRNVAQDITKFGQYYVKWSKSIQLNPNNLPEDLKVDMRKFLSFYTPWQRVNSNRVALLISSILMNNPDDRPNAEMALKECQSILKDVEIINAYQDNLQKEIDSRKKEIEYMEGQKQQYNKQNNPDINFQQQQQQMNQNNNIQNYFQQNNQNQNQTNFNNNFNNYNNNNVAQMGNQNQLYNQNPYNQLQNQFQSLQIQPQQQMQNQLLSLQQQQQFENQQQKNIQNPQQFIQQQYQQQQQQFQQNNQQMNIPQQQIQQQQQQQPQQQQYNLQNAQIKNINYNNQTNPVQNQVNAVNQIQNQFNPINQTLQQKEQSFPNNLPKDQFQFKNTNLPSIQQPLERILKQQQSSSGNQISGEATKMTIENQDIEVKNAQNQQDMRMNSQNSLQINSQLNYDVTGDEVIKQKVNEETLKNIILQYESDNSQQLKQIQYLIDQINDISIKTSLKMSDQYRYILEKKQIKGYNSYLINPDLTKSQLSGSINKIFKTYRMIKDGNVSPAKYYETFQNFMNLQKMLSTCEDNYIAPIFYIMNENKENILDLRESGGNENRQIPEQFSVAFQYYDRNLEDFIKQLKKRQLDHRTNQVIKEKLIICSQIAQAVQRMHQNNICHGNLNIRNISFHLEQKSFILNFYSLSETKLSPTEVFYFEESYMSPQQLQLNKTTKSDDIWSLGAIFHYILTFSPLFQANQTTKEMIIKYEQGYFSLWKNTNDYVQADEKKKSQYPPNIAKASELLSKIPNEEIAQIIHQMLSQDFNQRPTIQQVVEKFRDFKNNFSERRGAEQQMQQFQNPQINPINQK